MNLQRCFISDGPSHMFSVARNVRYGSETDISSPAEGRSGRGFAIGQKGTLLLPQTRAFRVQLQAIVVAPEHVGFSGRDADIEWHARTVFD